MHTRAEWEQLWRGIGKGPSVEHFHKPRSVSAETRQHPPEAFCTHMDRDTMKGSLGQGSGKGYMVGGWVWSTSVFEFSLAVFTPFSLLPQICLLSSF